MTDSHFMVWDHNRPRHNMGARQHQLPCLAVPYQAAALRIGYAIGTVKGHLTGGRKALKLLLSFGPAGGALFAQVA